MAHQAIPADARQRTSERQGKAASVASLDGAAPLDEAKLQATLAQIRNSAKTEAASINQSAKDLKSGNAVARGFNSVVNLFNHKQDRMESQRQNAVKALTSTLPGDLETFHNLITAAGDDPTKQKAATDFLQKALDRTQSAVDGYKTKATDLSKSNKFWSGIVADTISGVGVAVGVGLSLTGVGAPIGAGLIAASVAGGGALSLGSRALLDNQFDIRKEGLTTFVIGGLSGAATALTAGASGAIAGRISTGAAKAFGAQAVKGALVKGTIMATARGLTSSVVGASISGAQQIAEEHATGYSSGAGKRIAKAMGVGAVGGFVGGALWSGVSSAMDAVIPAAINRLPGSLAGSVNSASERIGQSRAGRIVTNTLSGAFYGGPVGATGTALASWMTGEKMTREEFWNQFIGGAINGGAVYGAWAGTPGGQRDMEASGSFALEKPGSRAPNFRNLKVTLHNEPGQWRTHKPQRPTTRNQSSDNTPAVTISKPASGSAKSHPTGRSKTGAKRPADRRSLPLKPLTTRLSAMRQRIGLLPALPPVDTSDSSRKEAASR